MAVGLAGVTATPALAAGTGVISGTVTGTSSTPLQGVLVQVFLCDPNYNPLSQENCWTSVNTGGQILTAANGTYSIPNLDPGQYTAAFFPQGANAGYAYEFWDNKTSLANATAFSVANGVTSTVSPNLQVGAIISGSILGPDGLPAPLTMVSVTNTATPNQSSSAFVESDGTYQLVGLQPGEYYMWAGPDYSPGNPSTLVREYYDDKPDAATANRFTVGSGQTFTANFQLADGGIISGNVKNTSSANLPGIDVTIFEENEFGYWQQIKTTTTDASGNYTLNGLETGAYVVRFSDFGGTYAQRYAGNVVDRSAATEFQVGPGVNATGVNIQLSAGGGITGIVTQTPTGGSATPSNQGYVDVIKVTGGVHEAVSSIQTNASGAYTLTGLAAGNYTIQTAGDNTAAWAQTYRGPAYYPEDATTVAVSGTTTTNAGTTNIVPGTTLRGTFTDTNLAPVPTVDVKILFERSPGNWVAPPPAGGSGDQISYNVSRLPPGRYVVYFEDTATTDKYVTQYYNNKPTFGTATVIEAPNGGLFQNISAQLTKTPHPALTASASVTPASPNGSNGWYKTGNVTVTLTAGGGTVVPNTLEYKIAPATTWSTYTAPIVVSANGTTAITYRAVEEDLQNSAEGAVTIKRDIALPTVSSTISGRTVTVTSADTGSSGVASTEYRLGTTGSFLPYTAPVNVGNGAVTFQFRATDNAGNVSTIGSRDVPAAVGAVTLTVTPNPAAPNGTNGWYTSDVTVTGSGTAELGGPVTIQSKIGVGGTYTNTASRVVSTSGTTELFFRGSDQFGNQSSETPVTIKLDKIAPSASHSASVRTVTITATDIPSGVAQREYRINGTGAWQIYGSPVTVPETASSLEYRAVDNAGNVSTPVSVPFTPGLPVPDRISGPNRYATGVAASQASYPEGSDVVYVTTGTGFPDALAAGPAAAFDGGPLLLLEPGAIPAVVSTELERLDPDRIVVIGGTPSVSAAVFAQLDAAYGEVTRIQGANRYETSRNVATETFPSATVAYIATGITFPDALAAGGAAGANDAPVILVQGTATTLDAATATLLDDLGVTEVKVLGSADSVSNGILNAIDALPGITAERLAGPNRYETSRLLNADAFAGTSPEYVFLSTGANFPDALAGSAWAAKEKAPLYTVQTTCIPPAVLADITELAPEEIILLGGTPSLSEAVFNLTPCA